MFCPEGFSNLSGIIEKLLVARRIDTHTEYLKRFCSENAKGIVAVFRHGDDGSRSEGEIVVIAW